MILELHIGTFGNSSILASGVETQGLRVSLQKMTLKGGGIMLFNASSIPFWGMQMSWLMQQ